MYKNEVWQCDTLFHSIPLLRTLVQSKRLKVWEIYYILYEIMKDNVIRCIACKQVKTKMD